MATIEPGGSTAPSPVPPGATMVEVTDDTFVQAVLEESHRRPVVVDFWAEWCAPCRMIGPVLERLATERGGEFLLAKLDVDNNPQAAQAFRIQGIPAVKAFRDGKLVDEFVGAIPEDLIHQFIDGLVPSDADRAVARAEELEAGGQAAEAERLFREAFEADAKNVGAALGLAEAVRRARRRGPADGRVPAQARRGPVLSAPAVSRSRWTPGAPVLLREVIRARIWTARPVTVVRDDRDLVALYLSPCARWKG